MLYHVVSQSDWQSQLHLDHFTPPGILKEGFIHCCTETQMAGVLQRYFSGQSNLLVISIDEYKLRAAVKYEPGTGNELFPHVYGSINKDVVLKVECI